MNSEKKNYDFKIRYKLDIIFLRFMYGVKKLERNCQQNIVQIEFMMRVYLSGESLEIQQLPTR